MPRPRDSCRPARGIETASSKRDTSDSFRVTFGMPYRIGEPGPSWKGGPSVTAMLPDALQPFDGCPAPI